MHVWVGVVVVCEYTCLCVACGRVVVCEYTFVCISASAFRMVDTSLQVYVHVSVITQVH